MILVGIDIGQKQDPTALAVAQPKAKLYAPLKRELPHYVVRGVERLPLGTPYPEVAEHLGMRIETIRERMIEIADRKAEEEGLLPKDRERLYRHASRGPRVMVDATGVGLPVVDLLRKKNRGSTIVGCYFTYGDRLTERSDPNELTVGKAFLVSRLQSLLQTGRITLPRTREAGVLRDELLNYEIRVNEKGNDTYGAFKVGTHDDLVTALGLAVLVDPTPMKIAKLPWAA